MLFKVTCRVWQGGPRGRGGFGYPTHEIDVAEAEEAASEALRIAQVKQWGAVYAVTPKTTPVLEAVLA